MKKYNHYSILAAIFRYPDNGYKEHVVECMSLLNEHNPSAAKEMLRFAEFVKNEPLYKIEEVFNKTFHIQAICYLDLGYVLFGEDYKRGEFLVKMKNEQRLVNNDCGDELSDNLTNVLTLMTLIDDQEFLNEFSVRILIPAIEKMLSEFEASRMALKEKILKKKHKVLIQEGLPNKNIYQHALQALLMVVQKDFEGIHYEETKVNPSIGGNFLVNCDSCATDEKPATQKVKEKETV